MYESIHLVFKPRNYKPADGSADDGTDAEQRNQPPASGAQRAPSGIVRRHDDI